MQHSRPIRISLRCCGITAFVVCAVFAPYHAPAQSDTIHHLLDRLHPMASHSGAQPGYLGVLVEDVDNESFARLRLTEKRGAVVSLIDHDAPAGQIGIKVDDVVLAVNGQKIENAAQFRSQMHEIAPGRSISLLILRDGNQQTVAVTLVEQRHLERDVWNQLNSPGGLSPQTPGSMSLLSSSAADTPPSGFHLPFFGQELKAGAIVEPLTAQMAGYLGVPGGVLVKQVARKSLAEAAGLRIYDIVLRVGNEPIKTGADWDRALRANEGKQVQIAILRDRHQQTLMMQVDSRRRK